MTENNTKNQIILASQSPFRAQLLNRLQINFTQISANVDESELENETPQELTQRLARLKAMSIFEKTEPNLQKNTIIIGSDQVACHEGSILGKPHNRANAITQLSRFSNSQVDFYTAVSVVTAIKTFNYLDLTTVHFKKLSTQSIENYVDNEDVLNCAGSFKSEGLGISLFKKIENNDPTALIGLPMIWLANCLQEIGIKIPNT